MHDFKETIQKYKNQVYTQCYYSLDSREDAEDATQEVFFKMWKKWNQLKGENIRAWLYRVARNTCMDAHRKKQRNRTIQTGQDFDSLLSRTPNQQPNPRSHAHSKELQGKIKSALNKLREPHKSIVILREIQNRSYAEISNILEIPLSTVKVYLYRGRRMLRDLLREKVAHE